MCDPNASLDYSDMVLAQLEDELKKLRPIGELLCSSKHTTLRLHCGSCMDQFEIGDTFEIPDGQPEPFTAKAEVGGTCPGCGEGALQLVVYFCGEDKGEAVMEYLDAREYVQPELSELAQPKPHYWDCNNPSCKYAGGWGVEPPVTRDCPLCRTGTLVSREDKK